MGKPSGAKVNVEPFCDYKQQRSSVGNHSWSVPKLIELTRELPVIEIPLSNLYIFYTYDKLTLRNLVEHMKSALNANLNYPIILDEDGVVMDGRHRIMKALLNGELTIKAVRFEENPIPDEEKD